MGRGSAPLTSPPLYVLKPLPLTLHYRCLHCRRCRNSNSKEGVEKKRKIREIRRIRGWRPYLLYGKAFPVYTYACTYVRSRFEFTRCATYTLVLLVHCMHVILFFLFSFLLYMPFVHLYDIFVSATTLGAGWLGEGKGPPKNGILGSLASSCFSRFFSLASKCLFVRMCAPLGSETKGRSVCLCLCLSE